MLPTYRMTLADGGVRDAGELIYAHPGPTWQVLSFEMRVLPQVLPTVQIVQQAGMVDAMREARWSA